MVKKHEAGDASEPSEPPYSGKVRESAQQIWLAGLGAFAKAQEEGGKVFESLVKEGLTIQRKTQTAAEARIAEATNKMTKMATMASELQSKAGNQWDKLETIFEDRVAKALKKLGVPSAKDVEELQARIDELTQALQQMKSSTAAAAPPPPTPKAAAKAPVKAVKAVKAVKPTVEKKPGKTRLKNMI